MILNIDEVQGSKIVVFEIPDLEKRLLEEKGTNSHWYPPDCPYGINAYKHISFKPVNNKASQKFGLD